MKKYLALISGGSIVALAGCGGSASGPASASNTPSAGKGANTLTMARCMRSHGVPNFPDPSAGGGFSLEQSLGSSAVTVNGQTVAGPVFLAAARACKLFPGGSGAPPPLTASQRQRILAFAACMRSHGVPDFPDPNFSGGGILRRLPPGANPQSPVFRQAVTTCGGPFKHRRLF
jgi:hypothetical protein